MHFIFFRKQNNVTNNLLDLSDLDGLSNSNSNSEAIFLMPEDNINSNLNPTAIPFSPMVDISVNNTIPFPDAFTNSKTQENQVPGTLEIYFMLIPS